MGGIHDVRRLHKTDNLLARKEVKGIYPKQRAQTRGDVVGNIISYYSGRVFRA